MHNLVPQFIQTNARQKVFSGQFPALALFVDITGFTLVTSALIGYGKEGAEILADALITVFTPPVQSIYDHGGLISAFIGDGIVALFPNPTDETYRRATLAAWRIYQHMSANTAYVSPYGTFTFTVEVSLADGLVDWQIWQGDTPSPAYQPAQNYAYHFAGEAIDRAIWGEQFVTGGDIIISRSVRDRLARTAPNLAQTEPIVIADDTPAAIFRLLALNELSLSSSPIPTPTANTEADTETDPHLPFFSPDLQTLATQGEFRQVLSLFINLKTMPTPEDPFGRQLFQLLHRYGGYLCRVGRIGAQDAGCTLLLFWGAPTSHENDIERALNFILDLQAQTTIPLRAGISYHMAYAGFIGSPLREEYTCHGNYVILAARQMITAPWGRIWLDEATAQRAQDQFDLALVGEQTYKGFAEPQLAFELRGLRVKETPPRYQGNLVGRQEEIDQLDAALQPIFAREFAGLIEVIGEAGIGKSRLIYELQQSLGHTVRWFHCPCDEILRRPLNPFRHWLSHYFTQDNNASDAENKAYFNQALDRLLSQLNDPTLAVELERVQSFLGALIGLHWADSLYEQLEPRMRFENTLEALKTLLLAESLRQPVVLEIEDAHWLDTDSEQFLQRLSSHPTPYPLVIIVASRTPLDQAKFDPDAPWHSIHLEPLSATGISHITAQLLGQNPTPTLNQRLLDRSEGNPFFIEQILLYLREQNLLVETPEGIAPATTGILLPDDVQAVLIARLDRLTAAVKSVVQTAAVLGREFEVRILSQMLRHDSDLATKVREAESEAIWTSLSELRYLFKHTLLRDAAYDMQLRARLRELHRLAGDTIKQVYQANLASYYPELAYHYQKAEVTPEEQTYAKLAGEQAAANFANAEALAYFTRALELTPSTDRSTTYELLLARVHIYSLQGDRDSEVRDLTTLQTLADQMTDEATVVAARRAHIGYCHTRYLETTGDFPNAALAAEETITQAQLGQESEMEAMGRLRWCVALWRQGQYDAARNQAERMLALARQQGMRAMETNATLQLGNVALLTGDYATAATHYQQTLPAYREQNNFMGQGASLFNLSEIEIYHGDYQAALAYQKEGLALFQRAGSRRHIAQTLQTMGYSLWAIGDYEAAIQHLESALTMIRAMGNRNYEASTHRHLGMLYRDLGHYDTAAQHFTDSLAVVQEIGNPRSEALTLLEMGLLAQHQAAPQTAMPQFEAVITFGTDLGLSYLRASGLTFLAHSLVDLGRIEEALSPYQEALSIRRELGEHHLAQEILAGLARLALTQNEPEQALSYVEEILHHLETRSLDGTVEPLRIYLTCYQVLRANQDPQAGAILADGHQLLQDRAAKISDPALCQSFLHQITAHRQILSEFAARQ